jgi:hypothetical protein
MFSSLSNTPTQLAEPLSFARLLRRAWEINTTLTVFVLLAMGLFLAGVIGMLIDPRIVLGMPNWAKSTKFGMSLALYGATLLALLPLLPSRPRLAAIIGHASGGILILEIVLIALQAVRGVPMHFNIGTTFDATLWGIMSVSIMIFWVITLIGVVLVMREKFTDRVLGWGVRLGMLIVLIGFAQGFLMTSPNATQMSALTRGEQIDLIGAHTVGALDGGPGIPLLGWSTQHGDLRIGHFIGIHAIQVVGLLALLLRRSKIKIPTQVALVWISAAVYFGLVVLVTWQALRDQPLLAPDQLTLNALFGLIGVGGLATISTLLRDRQR